MMLTKPDTPLNMDTKLLLTLSLAVLFRIHVVQCQTGEAVCRPTNIADAEFEVEFNLNTAGDASITDISFYMASEDDNFTTLFNSTPCFDDTKTGNVFSVDFSVDTDAILPCGAEALISGTEYKFAALASGINTVYTFTCDTDNLGPLPTEVSDITFETPVLAATLRAHNNARDVTFQAVQNGVPITESDLGNPMYLRLVYDKKYTDNSLVDMDYTFHTAPLIQTAAATDVTIRIITRSLGTRVCVTGTLTGNEFNTCKVVKVANPAYVNVPLAYVTTSNGGETAKGEFKGLKIVSLDERVCVTLTITTSNGVSSYAVLPDSVLDTSYRLAALQDWFVTIVGTQAGTTLSFETNGGFDMVEAAITLPGGGIPGTITNVPIDEGETFTISCISSIGVDMKGCTSVFVTSNKPLAVIVGGESQIASRGAPGEFATQIPGLSSYSQRFIMPLYPSTINGYIVVTDNFFAATFNVTSAGSPVTGVRSGDIRTFVDKDITVSEPVLILVATFDSSNGKPGLSLLPSLEQWGLYQTIHIREGLTYDIVILATTGSLLSITYDVYGSFSATTLPSTSGTLSDIGGTTTTIPGTEGIDREEYSFTLVISSDPSPSSKIVEGILTFHAGSSNKPFLLLATEIQPGSAATIHGCGIKFPPINPCVSTLSTHVIDDDFETDYYVGPGDGLDNDCDGRVDEEWEDGLADPAPADSDALVDEDLGPKTENAVGIYAKTSWVSNTADFSGDHTQVVHVEGCNVHDPDTSIGSITEFRHNTALSSIFDQLYVIQTLQFKTFGFVDGPINVNRPVYFRVYYGFCYGTLIGSKCENSCTGVGLGKRSVEDSDNFVDLKLDILANTVTEVNVNITEKIVTGTGSEKKHACSTLSAFWVTTTFVLLMILVESGVVATMFYRRFVFGNMKKNL